MATTALFTSAILLGSASFLLVTFLPAMAVRSWVGLAISTQAMCQVTPSSSVVSILTRMVSSSYPSSVKFAGLGAGGTEKSRGSSRVLFRSNFPSTTSSTISSSSARAPEISSLIRPLSSSSHSE